MTLIKKLALLSMSAVVLAGCQGQSETQVNDAEIEETTTSSAEETNAEDTSSSSESSNSNETTSSTVEDDATDGAGGTDESDDAEASAGQSSANQGEVAEDSDITSVYEEILSLDTELSSDATYNFMSNEEDGFIRIEVRQDNPSGDVANLVGTYRYNSNTGLIEKLDIVSNEYEALN